MSNSSSIRPLETFSSLWDGFVMMQSNYNRWKNTFSSWPALHDTATLSECLSDLHWNSGRKEMVLPFILFAEG